MKITTVSSVFVSLCILGLAGAPPARAQVPQGCSLKLPQGIESALNSVLLGACERHDACWRTRNPCGGPYLDTSWKASCDLQFLGDLTGVCVTGTAILSFPNVDFSSEADFLQACEAGAAAAYAGVSAGFVYWYDTQCRNGCNLMACQTIGLPLPFDCCFTFPCECFTDAMCDFLPAPEWGTWECRSCRCMLTNSPLVLHLPDYYSSIEGEGQDWWREGFCGPEGPTICLDWRGDGDVACTAWTSPASGVAFVVSLSEGDISHLAVGLPVRAEPWRHFFGNVTKGWDGSFPFANGFEALAAHCGQSADAGSEIDLTECGSSLYVWTDLSADGALDVDELFEFQDLGVETLGDVRKTGKTDRCGNTFPAESHATCSDRPGRCGTWLDVFFESRYPAAP